MAKRYYVDTSDTPFPRIRVADPSDPFITPLTLGEAKRQLIESAQYQIDHWRSIIADTRALRADQVEG